MKKNKFNLSKLLNLRKTSGKKWTILIYANGNNELEPEIYTAFKKIKHELIDTDINVVVQLARAPMDLVNKLRSKVNFKPLEQWNGVRRYLMNSKKITKVEDVGNVNMADSHTLYEFITWGITRYPSEHTMLILSGHGAGFVGALTDFTHSYPYIMSLQGMINAIYKSKQNTGKDIDCLVLDICYMNMIELWYEFSYIPSNPIKNLLVAIDNVALEGLSYNLIIKCLQENIKNKIEISDILANVVQEFNENNTTFNKLLFVNLIKDNFTKLKNLVDVLSHLIISKDINLLGELEKWWYVKPNHPFISIIDLNDMLSASFPKEYNMRKNMTDILQKIILYPSISVIPKKLNKGPSLYMPKNFNQYTEFKNYYSNLLFLYKNNWMKVIQGNHTTAELNNHKVKKIYDVLAPPMPLKIEYVVSSVLEQNPGFTIERASQILKELGWY